MGIFYQYLVDGLLSSVFVFPDPKLPILELEYMASLDCVLLHFLQKHYQS